MQHSNQHLLSCPCPLTDDSYDRSLYPPGTTCTNGKPNGPSGTKVVYDETIDLNSTELNAGEQLSCQLL